MKKPFFALILLLLTACGVPDGKVRISGSYSSFTEGGEFRLLSPDGGTDRIEIVQLLDGEFEVVCNTNGLSTYYLIYPDNSRLVLWAGSGDHVTITERGEGLWKVRVAGNKENELYTEFRLQTEPGDTAKLRPAAAQFIRKHPRSAVSRYLFTEFFVLPPRVPTDSVDALFEVMKQASPKDAALAALEGHLQQRRLLQVGSRMPDFDLSTNDSVRHTLASYKGKHLLFYFWAGWADASSYLHSTLASLKQRMENPTDGSAPVPVELLAYSLDVDSTMFRLNRGNEKKDIPMFCDFKGFNSPLVTQWGVRTLPLIILVAPDGTIKALGKDTKEVERGVKE